MCNSNCKLSKNNKAKKEVTCKPSKFILTYICTFSDGSKETVSTLFISTPINPIFCDIPNPLDYNKAAKKLLRLLTNIQKKLAEKYKASGKASPNLIKKSSVLKTTSDGTCIDGGKCNGQCCMSESECKDFFGPNNCVKCGSSSSCWILSSN